MTALEARGLLDRAVETLPSAAGAGRARGARRAADARRARRAAGLCQDRAVLRHRRRAACRTSRISNATCSTISPARMAKKYAAEIGSHRLRREIIARVVANDLVNRGGPAFVSRLQDLTGRSAADVVRAFTIARDGYGLTRALCRDRRAGQPASTARRSSISMPRSAASSMPATVWFLKNADETPIGERIAWLQEARAGAGAEACLAAARLHARQAGRARPRLLQGRRAGEARRAAGAARRGGADPRHRDRGAGRARSTWSPRPRRSSPSPKPSASAASRKPCARSPSPTIMTGLRLSRAADMIGAARRGIAVSALVGLRQGRPIRSAPGSRPAANASRERASGCRR